MGTEHPARGADDGTVEGSGFRDRLQTYADELLAELSLTGSPRGWRLSDGRRHPTRRKALESLLVTIGDLLRLDDLSPFSEDRRDTVLRQLTRHPQDLERDALATVLDVLGVLVIEAGDDTIVYGRAKSEQYIRPRSTSMLTWEGLFGRDQVPGLRSWLDGETIDQGTERAKLEATRRHLLVLLRARHQDTLAHRTRQALRRRNLRLLSLILAVVLGSLVLLTVLVELPPRDPRGPVAALAATLAEAFGATAAPDPGRVAAVGVVLGVLAGMLGAAVSGTIKARDRLTRAKDIETFSDGMFAQILVGGAAAFATILVFKSGLIAVAGFDATTVLGQTVIGFLAGFSEPFFLGTVERAATLGVSEQDPASPDAVVS